MSSISAGEVVVHHIVEHEGAWFDPLTLFDGLSPDVLDENRAWMEERGAICPTTGKLILCVQSYLVEAGGRKVLVDTGVGNHKARPGQPFWSQSTSSTYLDGLGRLGFGVEDIDVVICTHLHLDHVGWNTRLQDGCWVPTFPNATYIFSEREYAYWDERNRASPIAAFGDSILPVVEAGKARLVGSDYRLDETISLLPTPGHTVDHLAVEIRSNDALAVIAGDVFHSPLQIKYPDLALSIDYDKKLSSITRRSCLSRWFDERAVLFPNHFPPKSAINITKDNDGFGYVHA